MTAYLVGAGPGDPGLLTVRGAEVLSTAEVVLYDRLVEPALLDLAPDEALRVDVGKRPGAGEADAQTAINALLIEHARRGASVVRLKGGDPYVFGRGGEEALALEAAGLDYEVVPGVSSLLAAPAAAGVPLTLRGVASAVVVLTGHDAGRGSEESTVPWGLLGASEATLVILMGGATRAAVAERLLGAGRAPETPVLVVSDATTPRQRSLRLRLDELAAAEVTGATTLVVGEVARRELASYERRPLHGWRVAVTRSSADAPALARLLAAEGAESVGVPTVFVAAPADGGKTLRAALERVASLAWIVCTSVHGVEALFGCLRDARSLAGVRIGAIGTATAAAFRRHGIEPDLVPARYLGEGLLEAFPAPRPGEGAVLLPVADRAGPRLAEGLRAAGWEVEQVEAYATLHPPPDGQLSTRLAGAHVVTFASSSAVEGLLEAVGREAIPPVVATIGPVTSATAREAGLEVQVEAAEHTLPGLVAALVAYARATPRPAR